MHFAFEPGFASSLRLIQNREGELVQNISLFVYPGIYLDEGEAFRPQGEDTALCNIENVLSVFDGASAGEADASHVVDHFRDGAFALDPQLPAFLGDFQALGAEGQAEDHILGGGCDVGETADSGKVIGSAVGVDIAEAVHFQCAHEAPVQAAAVVEVKLHGHITDGAGSDHGAELAPAGGKTTDAAGLYSQGQLVEDSLGRRVFGSFFRDTDADVDDVAGFQFFRGPAADDRGSQVFPLIADFGILFFQASVPVLHVGGGHVDVAGESAEDFIVLLLGADDHHVHQRGRDDHIPGPAKVGAEPVYLHDDLPVIAPGQLGEGESVDGEVFIFKGDIAVGVCAGGLDEGNVRRGKTIVEIFFSLNLHHADERVVFRDGIEPGAFHAGIHEDPETHLRKVAVVSAGLGPQGMGHGPQRKIVSLKPVFQDQFSNHRQGAVMAGDNSSHRAPDDVGLGSPVRVHQTEAGGGDEGQSLRMAGGEKTLPDGVVELLGAGHGGK